MRTETIAIKVSKGFLLVAPIDIVRCQAQGNHTLICLADGQEVSVCKRLKQVELLLPEKMFCRVHHSHIVNLGRIEMWVNAGNGHLLLRGGSRIPVARGKKGRLKEMLSI